MNMDRPAADAFSNSPSDGVENLNSKIAEDQDKISPLPHEDISTSDCVPETTAYTASSTALQLPPHSQRHDNPHQLQYFRSRRIKKGEIEKPWLNKKKTPREKWATAFPIIGMLVGLLFAGLLVWDGVRGIPKHSYCPVLIEDFSHGLDPNVWTKEVELGGFGNGEFQETTSTTENVFIRNGALWIKPTLQTPALLTHNRTLNLLTICTATHHKHRNCIAHTNTTTGILIPPVKSGRINTATSARIKYGRVEVVARLPTGDWLWPAIWLLPRSNTYGPWPRSGEIDIAESRGNNYSYAAGGTNAVRGTLHWGPSPDTDAWWRTTKAQTGVRGTPWADGFHTFGLEWSEKYLFTYIDSRLLQVLYVAFDEGFWARGMFPPADALGRTLVNPWSRTGRDATPFDQEFYLVLSVGVGGTNGWFPDGVGGKPWTDGSPTAKQEFWDARDEWYPTWQGGGQMIVKSVKMWQQKGYNGCT